MGDTSANMAHWAGIYGGAPATEATVVSAAAATAGTVSSPTSGGSGGSPTRLGGVHPGVEGGRVGKPSRRRSRASRRAPVTLLNTDTSNFRAMVQQFTGIPPGPYGAAGAGGPVISFGAGGAEYGAVPVRPSPTSAVTSFDHRAATSLQGQLFRQHQHQHQHYGGDVGYGDMSFLHFESSAEDRLLLQSIQAAQMMPRPASTNNTNGYNFG